MWLTERRFGEAAIVDIHGALRGSAASELFQVTVRGQLAAVPRILIVNFADTTAVDDEAARTWSALASAARQRGIDVRVAGDLVRLAREGVVQAGAVPFRCFATVDDALTDIRTELEHRHSRAAGGPGRRLLLAVRRLFSNT